MNNQIIDVLDGVVAQVEGVTRDQVVQIVRRFDETIKENRDIDIMRERLQCLFPNMFKKGIGNITEKDYINFLDQKDIDLDFAKSHPITYLQETLESFRDQLLAIFPDEEFRHAYRVLNGEQIKKKIALNGSRALLDTIGYRLVPQNICQFPTMIDTFETLFSNKIVFKLNTLAFDYREFREILNDSSLYYRAIHYYIDIKGHMIEVQLRTPAIDIWSTIHHATMYKGIIETQTEQRVQIEKLGFMANIVDYGTLLNCSIQTGSKVGS